MSKVEKVIEFLMGVQSRPSYVKSDDFYIDEYCNLLDIVMFGSYHIKLQYDPSYSGMDTASADDGCGYGKADLLYAYDILDSRDEILEIWNE